MFNPGYDSYKVFDGLDSFQNRIVAFADVMGVRNRMMRAESPRDLEFFSRIIYMFANQPFAEGKLEVVMFSDCMYIVADVEHLDTLICLLANFAFTLLVNRTVYINSNEEGDIKEEVIWDCLKLRGGITYGKVLVLDEEARKKKIPFRSNIVLGPAVITAYELESKEALFPRIIADNNIIDFIESNQKNPGDYSLVKESEEGYYYLDFWNYMFKETSGAQYYLACCIDYVEQELSSATSKETKNKNEKLIKQLTWYSNYLKNKRIAE